MSPCWRCVASPASSPRAALFHQSEPLPPHVIADSINIAVGVTRSAPPLIRFLIVPLLVFPARSIAHQFASPFNEDQLIHRGILPQRHHPTSVLHREADSSRKYPLCVLPTFFAPHPHRPMIVTSIWIGGFSSTCRVSHPDACVRLNLCATPRASFRPMHHDLIGLCHSL